MSERWARRIARDGANAKLVMDADVEGRILSPQEYTQSRCKIVETQVKELRTRLDELSRLDEKAFPGVQKERENCLNRLTPLVRERKVLKRSARGLIEDIEDEIKAIKSREVATTTIDNDVIAEAYTNSICEQFCGAAKQKKMNFDPGKFGKAAVEYYGAKQEEEGGDLVHCHIFRYMLKIDVKTAHIIPKSLKDDVIEHLFGSAERDSRASPKNSLMLYYAIEEAMDKGQIAFIPIPTKENEPSRWKLVLIDDLVREKGVFCCGRVEPHYVRFGDIENQELEFPNDSRPARRSLYLQFVISLIKVKKERNSDEMARLMTRLALENEGGTLWPSPGEYLRKSTLQVVARNICGLVLPKSMIDTTTFESEGLDSGPDGDDMELECLLNVNTATN